MCPCDLARQSELDVEFGFSDNSPVSATQTDLRVPVQDRAHRTRNALVTAAAQEFGTRGYAATTAKSIATRAGVAVGSFYQYFPNKDAVLHELAADRARAISESTLRRLESPTGPLPADPTLLRAMVRVAMLQIVDEVVRYHRDNRTLHAVMTERRNADPRLDRITTRAEHALIERIADLVRRWGRVPDPEAAAFVAFGAVEGGVHAHVLSQPMIDDERFRTALVDALIAITLPNGITTDS